MSRPTAALLIGLTALLTAACSGDGRDTQVEPVKLATASGSTLDSAPSVDFAAADDVTATQMGAEIQDGLEQLVQVGQVANAQGDAQASATGAHVVKVEANPGASSGPSVMATRSVVYTCAQFLGAGATGNITYTFDDVAPSAGWKSNLAFKDCAITVGARGYMVNGTLLYQYARYVSGSDFGFVGSTQNLVLSTSLNGQTIRSVNYALSYAFDIHNGTIVTSYATPSSVFRDLRVTATSTAIVVNMSAVVDMRERRGTVRIKLTDWRHDLTVGHAVSGTAVVTGANNTRAVVAPSATGYSVTYTDSQGRTKVFNYAYPA